MWLANAFLGLGVLPALSGAITHSPPIPSDLQKILDDAHDKSIYDYPTSITQGIVPKFIHSHNDYWRPVPFYSALSVGAVSIEADVYLVNGTLLVGHEPSALTAERTLKTLYIEPILSVLKSTNPQTTYSPKDSHNGVYDASSGQTLYLFIDLKTNGDLTFPVMVEALKPLREGGWLTEVSNGMYKEGAVTVIGTGNTPRAMVEANDPRDVFYDGPLPELDGSASDITNLVSPIASTSFQEQVGEFRGTELNSTQLDVLRSQIKTAHNKGIKVRYWETPGWPVSTRNVVWRTLWSIGTDLLNADDLEEAAGFSESSGDW